MSLVTWLLGEKLSRNSKTLS